MTDAQAALAHVREALAAGPTPGPWVTMPANAGVHCVARINAWEAVPPSDCELSHDSIDASFIAACSPANMTAIIAHVEAQEAEIERLRAGLRAVSDLIDESHGVAGLHRNGDVAPWSDLRTGGKYEEWLVAFDDALKEQR